MVRFENIIIIVLGACERLFSLDAIDTLPLVKCETLLMRYCCIKNYFSYFICILLFVLIGIGNKKFNDRIFLVHCTCTCTPWISIDICTDLTLTFLIVDFGTEEQKVQNSRTWTLGWSSCYSHCTNPNCTNRRKTNFKCRYVIWTRCQGHWDSWSIVLLTRLVIFS